MTNVFSEANAVQAARLLQEHGPVLITTHKSPDGDAMGSAMAMMLMLRKKGYQAIAMIPDAVADFLRWIPGYSELVVFDANPDANADIARKCGLRIALDYNHFSKTGKEMEALLRSTSGPVIMIDHHHSPEAIEGVLYSDTTFGSTCEMIYQWFESMGWASDIDRDIATCLYCGMMTDTGSFRFPSVTPETHRIVARLMETGMDHAHVHRSIYDNNLLNRLKLVGYALSEKLEVIEGTGTALISLSAEELRRFGYQPGDTEGLVNQALSVQGVFVAAFFREGNNEIKVSLRSSGSFDVNLLARRSWNGGGHKNAAGGSTTESLDAALTRFRAEMHELKDQILNS